MNERRKFLKNVAITPLSFGLLPCISKGVNSTSLIAPPPPPCNHTTADFYGEGPFYTPDPPFIEAGQLASEDEPGERLIISGVVRNLDCSQVIHDAVFDIWHAANEGDYDNTGGYHLRGKITSNASGFYMFETILPGKYLSRPSHIHIKVTTPDYPTLTTQIYFAGDELIPTDAAASQTDGTYDATHRIIDLTTNADGNLEGSWDIVVDGEGLVVTGMESLHIEKGMLYSAGPNPFSDELEIKYGVFNDANVAISVTDMQGKIVANLREEFHVADKYTAVWNPHGNLPNGTYFVLIKINDLQVHHLKVVRKKGYSTSY